MKKYEITKNGMDDYTLTYDDKIIHFKSKVGIVEELQAVNKKARLLMVKELAEQGMSIKDLTTEVKEGSKTTYDNSNRNFIEEAYIQEMQGKVFMKAIEDMLGIPFETLIADLDIKTEEESEKFALDLGECIIPSKERTQ